MCSRAPTLTLTQTPTPTIALTLIPTLTRTRTPGQVLTSLNGQPARQLPVSHLMSMLKASASPVAMVFTRRDTTQPPLLPPAAAAAAAIAAAATPPPLPPLPAAAAPALPTDAADLASLPPLASPSAPSEQPTASSSLQSASAPAGAAAAPAAAGSRQPSAAGSRQPSAYSAADVAARSASATSQPASQPPAPYSVGVPSAEGYSARTGSGAPAAAAERRATSTGPLPQASADAFPTLLPLEFAPGLLEDVFERAPPLDASQARARRKPSPAASLPCRTLPRRTSHPPSQHLSHCPSPSPSPSHPFSPPPAPSLLTTHLRRRCLPRYSPHSPRWSTPTPRRAGSTNASARRRCALPPSLYPLLLPPTLSLSLPLSPPPPSLRRRKGSPACFAPSPARLPPPMAAQEERTSSLIPTRDALALEAAELRKFTPTKPLAEISEEIKTEVAARRQKEGEVKRVKEKITTINARVRQLASQKRAPLPADMQKAVKTLGSVEITAQQSALLTKQMAESGAQQGWLPS